MKIALVCIAKNEEKYIDEWIDYHLKLGFDDIYIYENNWRYNKIKNHVITIPFDGEIKQILAYNTFISIYKNEYDWAAFFDVDEFLVLKKHTNVSKFLNDYKKFPAIGINWVLFGDNNISYNSDNNSVLNRFTKRQKDVNPHIKTIANLKYNIIMNVHCPINVDLVDTNYKLFKGHFNKIGDDNLAQLNHYFCKTRDEFTEKVNRGKADMNTKRDLIEFDWYNYNDIEDFSALNINRKNLFLFRISQTIKKNLFLYLKYRKILKSIFYKFKKVDLH